MGYASAERERLHMQDDTSERRLKNHYDARVCKHLDAFAVSALAAEGATWTEERAIEEALKPATSVEPPRTRSDSAVPHEVGSL
jgi:hypothetical protein